jgi:hypothetical protein
MYPLDFIKAYYNWLGRQPEEFIYKRNEYLSVEWSIDNRLDLIVSGAVMTIYVSKEEEFTIRFGYKGTVISSLDLLTSSFLERYKRVLKRSPLLFKEVPMKSIASYLSMCPETLSRLRNIDTDQCFS